VRFPRSPLPVCDPGGAPSRSIVHLQDASDGDRLPGVWVRDDDLFICTSHSTLPTNKCGYVYNIVLGQAYHVEVVIGFRVGGTLSARVVVDGVQELSWSIASGSADNSEFIGKVVDVYSGNPWVDPLRGVMRRLVVQDATTLTRCAPLGSTLPATVRGEG